MKTAETNPIYQSQFLPIIQKAETKIKTMVLVAFLMQSPKLALAGAIWQVINSVKEKIPAQLHDKEAYVNGLIYKSDIFIKQYYSKPTVAFLKVREQLLASAPSDIATKISTPKELSTFVSNPRNLWAEAKGSPNVVNYPTELKRMINKLGGDPMTVYETGKKPISVWQKAELDTRYFDQMQHLQDLRTKGEDLCWISSHVNCSKRCEPWQGKLVSLSRSSTGLGFKVGTVDGHTVYSLTDIMAQVDKYGYHNNIICGFNCRHRLIPYRRGTKAPKEYKKGEIAQQRAIETKIREMERKIRVLKTQEHLYNKSGDTFTAKAYKTEWKKLESFYKRFCESNGYAWQEYRIKI